MPKKVSPPRPEQAAAQSDQLATLLTGELARVADGIVQTLGETLCEVVLHDIHQPEHSIVWIKGNVTNRAAGGTMSQIGLAMLSEGEAMQDRVNYVTRTRDGKILKSTSLALRDGAGRVFGLFCINIDITNLTAMEQTLRTLLAGDEMKVLTNIHFSNNLAEVAQVMLDEVIQQQGLTGPPNDIHRRLEFVRALEQRGFFGIRYSVPLLSDYLGVSRASIYNYLKEAARTTASDTPTP
jgi:predicted transcriptional regulator YheO